MGKPYAAEMLKLADTFASAMTSDIEALRKAVRTSGLAPLLAIGSGGSLTVAHALAALHRRFTSQIAAVATPLEAIAEPLEPRVGTWILSAGGRNVDILAAFRALVLREPRQIAVLCGGTDSPLADLARSHDFTDLLVYEPPAGKDGFLATNSLLGFVTLLTRAYRAEFGELKGDPDDFAAHVESLLAPGSRASSEWRAATEPLWGRSTTLVLFGTDARAGAIDLESKFTEAALGHLQIADYRNFAHGRHLWLARHAEISAVLALVSAADQALAERTLALIPPDVPQARLSLEGPAEAVALASLVASLQVSGWAGWARGIDPGRPRVPAFGRKLYHLSLPRSAGVRRHSNLSDRDAVAIERKAGLSTSVLAVQRDLDRWRAALNGFRDRLLDARFAAVALDYDGTVVDTRERFVPPRASMATEMIRILEAGIVLAIATGRGSSVRRDLRTCLPATLWSRVLIGYYNGAHVGWLSEDHVLDGTEGTCPTLAPLAMALRQHTELAQVASQTDRRFQITLEAKLPVPEHRLWDLANQILLMEGPLGASITRSSHSIDIIAPGVSKLNVLTRLRGYTPGDAILTIGDRGRWPGNDYELLREPFALSVDEISVDPTTCWNLAPRGQRGVAVTLGYLRGLTPEKTTLRFQAGALT